jgi:hypothetical protein
MRRDLAIVGKIVRDAPSRRAVARLVIVLHRVRRHGAHSRIRSLEFRGLIAGQGWQGRGGLAVWKRRIGRLLLDGKVPAIHRPIKL